MFSVCTKPANYVACYAHGNIESSKGRVEEYDLHV